jgi:hypothetical protein
MHSDASPALRLLHFGIPGYFPGSAADEVARRVENPRQPR